MNHLVSDFIGDILEQIKYKKAHPYIAREIEDHIELLREDYEEEGLAVDEAYRKAIEQMGDSTQIGKELYKTHKPKMEWSILLMILALMGMGIWALTIYSKHYSQSRQVQSQLLFIVIGLGGFLLTYLYDYKRFERWKELGYCIGVGILLYSAFFGQSVNGATLWIRIGSVRFNAVYLATPFLVIPYISIVRKRASGKIKDLFLLGIIACIPLIIIVGMPNLRNAILLGITFCMILIFYICSKSFKGNKAKSLSIIVGTLIIGVSLITYKVSQTPYMIKRVQYLAQSMESQESYIAMRSIRENAHFIGTGSYDPLSMNYMAWDEMSSEMILTFIVGSMGWGVAISLLVLLGVVILRLFEIALKIQEDYGRLICLSIATFFSIQFIVNIVVNLGYMPFVGMSLPFVSYGGSSLIINLMLLGIYLSVYRRKDLVTLCMNEKCEATSFAKENWE